MERPDHLRSTTIGILKIALPLVALALLSTVFLLAKAPNTDGAIPYAEIEEIARESRVSSAQISGVSTDGSVFEIIAESARPSALGVEVQGLNATVQTRSGVDIFIRAGEGDVNNQTQVAHLTGLTRLDTSNGYQMETMGLRASMDTGRIESDGELEVLTPFGEMTAGRMIIDDAPDGRGQRILFQDGVRLIYQPKQQD